MNYKLKRVVAVISDLPPVLKTLALVLVLIMSLSTIMEIAHIIGWRQFLISQISFGTIMVSLNSYFLFLILNNQRAKNIKDNYIRRDLFNKLNSKVEITDFKTLEEDLQLVREEVIIVQEQIKKLEDYVKNIKRS